MESTKEDIWYLYMIRCRDDSLYTGITTDISRRLAEHVEQGPKCAKYLRGKGPLELVYSQKVGDRGAALRLETSIKNLTKADKEKMSKSKSLMMLEN